MANDFNIDIDLGNFSEIEINIDIDTNQRYCKPAYKKSLRGDKLFNLIQ